MSIEFFQNTEASKQNVRVRPIEDQAQVKAQAKVLDALRATLKAETETMARMTPFSLDSTAEAAVDAMRPCDVEGIRVNALHAKNESQAATDKVFYNATIWMC
jgi:hypothetical protein